MARKTFEVLVGNVGKFATLEWFKFGVGRGTEKSTSKLTRTQTEVKDDETAAEECEISKFSTYGFHWIFLQRCSLLGSQEREDGLAM